jgi:hypothetical protein
VALAVPRCFVEKRARGLVGLLWLHAFMLRRSFPCVRVRVSVRRAGPCADVAPGAQQVHSVFSLVHPCMYVGGRTCHPARLAYTRRHR